MEPESDESLKLLYNPIFELLKEHSEEIIVGTTNYDKAIENFCDFKKYSCIDGFKEIRGAHRWTNGQFYYPERIEGETYVYLYKLHGSLDWKEHRHGDIVKTNEEARPTDPNYKGNLLIYPTLDPKPRENEPFTTIVNEFKKRISDADLCIVVGFSFRDKYISDLILQLMSTNKLIIIGEKANNGLRNLLGENVHPKAEEKESPYGIKIISIMDNNAGLIPHNISKERIEDIVGTIKELMSS
jgi:hypothetical protein